MRLTLLCSIVSFAWACLFLLGCQSYRLGSPTKIAFDSLFIQPAQNASFAPQAQQLLSTQIRKSIIRDGRVSLSNHPSQADARLEVELLDYQRNLSAYRRDDIDLARSYSLTLLAKISLWDARQKVYLFKDRTVQASQQSYVENPYQANAISAQNFNAAEYNSMPQLTHRLAVNISNEVLSPW